MADFLLSRTWRGLQFLPCAARALVAVPAIPERQPGGFTRIAEEFLAAAEYRGARDLLSGPQPCESPMPTALSTRHGMVYEIRAILRGPSGTSAGLVSVWIVRHGETHPTLVTAYPGGPE